jgi:NTE family protein/lysophospholipid hydrolase
MKDICGGIVIMVNVSPEEDLQVPDKYTMTPSDMEVLWGKINPFKDKVVFPRIHDIMMRTILVGSARMKALASKSADYDFSPPIDGFGMLEFDSIDEIINVGYHYAKKRIIELDMKGL